MGQPVSSLSSTPYTYKSPLGSFKGTLVLDDKTKKPMCYRFANIRYALPPTGDYRWEKPRPVPDDYDYSSYNYEEFGLPCPAPHVSNPNIDYLNSYTDKSEDCLYVNIWTPLSAIEKPGETLPVLFYIHGGWLQYGAASQSPIYDPSDLMSTPNLTSKYIIVSAGYRLNAFGFLSGEELGPEVSNFGLWDQRAALEWTAKNISNFGGDPDKITVSGLSAGSYSTFFQLAYEMYHPQEKQIIKQVVHFSNALAVQPKDTKETMAQFDEFCDKFGIDKTLDASKKLSELKKIDQHEIVKMIPEMKLHTFRAVTDDSFISKTLLADIKSGVYAKKLTDRNIKMIIGQVSNEPPLYGALNTPSTKSELVIQLENYYPKSTLDDLMEMYYPKDLTEDDPDFQKKLTDVFGLICADTQVTASTRGYLNNLIKGGFPLSSIHRYHIDFITKKSKATLAEHGVLSGVTHGMDQPLWFYAVSATGSIDEDESKCVLEFIKPYTDFICMKGIDWGTSDIKEVRSFNANGSVTIEKDGYWDEACEIADRIYDAQLK